MYKRQGHIYIYIYIEIEIDGAIYIDSCVCYGCGRARVCGYSMLRSKNTDLLPIVVVGVALP